MRRAGALLGLAAAHAKGEDGGHLHLLGRAVAAEARLLANESDDDEHAANADRALSARERDPAGCQLRHRGVGRPEDKAAAGY